MINGRLNLTLKGGTALCGMDAHYWPGKPTTAHRAFVLLAKELKPDLLIYDGDVIDCANASRHPPIGWEGHPEIHEEIATGQDRLQEVRRAAPKARRVWTLGNHDARFETRIASLIPQLKGVFGVHLKDHFPDWECAWALKIGNCLIKHRWHGGQHAAYNNALKAGVSVVSGHLHRLNLYSINDERGTRWGVEGGMLADADGPQFTGYTESNPLNWQSGFLVLTWDRHGALLCPEMVHVIRPGLVSFRGQSIKV